FTPQGIRPVIAGLLLGCGIYLRRRVDPMHTLCFAAMLILFFRPLDVFAAGFQFSFVLVLGILVFTTPVAGALGGWADPDIEVLERFGKLTPLQSFRRGFIHRARQVIAATVVAWVVSVPLVAYHFEQFTPWAVPITLILSPLVFAALGA